MRSGLATDVVDRNGRRLLDIDTSFRPAPEVPAAEVPNVEAATGGSPIVVPTWVREQREKEPAAV